MMTPIQHAGLMLQAGGQAVHIDPAHGSYDGLTAAGQLYHDKGRGNGYVNVRTGSGSDPFPSALSVPEAGLSTPYT